MARLGDGRGAALPATTIQIVIGPRARSAAIVDASSHPVRPQARCGHWRCAIDGREPGFAFGVKLHFVFTFSTVVGLSDASTPRLQFGPYHWLTPSWGFLSNAREGLGSSWSHTPFFCSSPLVPLCQGDNAKNFNGHR
jgi:hypothetical protein